MVILNLKLDNIYMFKDFEIDFTFPRKLGNSIIEKEYLAAAPKINYKRVNIIMGANASGKTTFGKTLCKIENFLMGRSFSFFDTVDIKDKDSKINIIFVIDQYLFEYEVIFNKKHLIEKIRHIKLFKSYNLAKVKEKLKNTEFLEEKTELTEDNFFDSPVISKVCSSAFEDGESYRSFFRMKLSFYYTFASFTEKSKSDIDSDLLKKVEKNLKILDNSVEEVRVAVSKGLNGEEKESLENDYYIIFKNGDQIIVPDGNIKNIKDNRLSQGTIEAVELAYILDNIKKYNGIVYLDEQMAYMHTRLSNQVILKLVENLDSNEDSQLFVTTHDENVLDLNVPIHSFVFFVRDEDGIRSVNPEKTLSKNDRRLIEYVQNNYFDTNPNLDDFWE